jgi:hypothetical protein
MAKFEQVNPDFTYEDEDGDILEVQCWSSSAVQFNIGVTHAVVFNKKSLTKFIKRLKVIAEKLD